MYNSRRKNRRLLLSNKNLWGEVLFLLLFLFTCYYILTINFAKPIGITRCCYDDHNLGEESESFKLDDILLSVHKPKKDKSIFFHETTCSSTGQLQLTARQACAIESAALFNPNYDIFVLFASPRLKLNESIKSSFNLQRMLNTHKNIYLRNVNLWRYADGTPIYDWLQDGKLFESLFLESHISDLLRYLTLWRWGGTYLDLDFIFFKTLENIKPNFAGAESYLFIAAGVVNFASDGFGHKIAELCLKDFEQHFIGSMWGYNGPGVITRVLKKICNTTSPQIMTRNRCSGFKVFREEAFYAIGHWNWSYIFYEEYLQESLDLTKNSIAIHVWNKYSSNRVVRVGSKVAYGIYADKYCPNIYRSCGRYF